jgi:hypothetical protein
MTGAGQFEGLVGEVAVRQGIFRVSLAVGLEMRQVPPVDEVDLDPRRALLGEGSVDLRIVRPFDLVQQCADHRVRQPVRLIGPHAHATVDERGRHDEGEAELGIARAGGAPVAGDVERRPIGSDADAGDVGRRERLLVAQGEDAVDRGKGTTRNAGTRRSATSVRRSGLPLGAGGGSGGRRCSAGRVRSTPPPRFRCA